MRVNIYAEELSERVEIITKVIDGVEFTALRFYLELPVTTWIDPNDHARGYVQTRGPFMHRPGDDDSAAVTFWGKRDLRQLLLLAIERLDAHYAAREGE